MFKPVINELKNIENVIIEKKTDNENLQIIITKTRLK